MMAIFWSGWIESCLSFYGRSRKQNTLALRLPSKFDNNPCNHLIYGNWRGLNTASLANTSNIEGLARKPRDLLNGTLKGELHGISL